MVDIAPSLLNDERLRAHFAPAMRGRNKTWHVTISCNGDLTNLLLPVEHRRMVLLDSDVLQQLDDALASLDLDYIPPGIADGADFRTITYRVGSKIRHIMIVDGVSADFPKRKQFNVVWKMLGKIAATVTR